MAARRPWRAGIARRSVMAVLVDTAGQPEHLRLRSVRSGPATLSLVDLHRPVRIPSWMPRVPARVAVAWGFAYAISAMVKGASGVVPKMKCGPPPYATLSVVAMLLEMGVGLAIVIAPLRRWGALAGVTLNLCFVGFAFGADAQNLPWKGCNCFF